MAVRKILFVSPPEPSGAAWLVNCFLELGIKTSVEARLSCGRVWLERKGKYLLHPQYESLKRFLPAFYSHPYFEFRNDLEVLWLHQWPLKEFKSYSQIILMTRDPRDSLYSRYRRMGFKLSFKEFLNFLNRETLFDKIDNWYFFHKAWLAMGTSLIVRFEDYKKDAQATLREVIAYLGLSYDSASIDSAIEASSFAKGRQGEKKYLTDHPYDDPGLFYREGYVGGWKESDEARALVSEIEKRTQDLLIYFGYIESPQKFDKSVLVPMPSSLFGFSSLLKGIELEGGYFKDQKSSAFSEEWHKKILSFATSLDRDLLKKSTEGFGRDGRMLISNLRTALKNSGSWNRQLDSKLKSLHAGESNLSCLKGFLKTRHPCFLRHMSLGGIKKILSKIKWHCRARRFLRTVKI